jgi:nucleoside-diphosphate-sugar epimerase
MPPIPSKGIVAVTGSTGFIGSWIVHTLLDRGYTVKACVRDANSEKAAFLRKMPQVTTKRLSIHSSDITVPGVFDSIFVGCHGVIHVADSLMSGEYAAEQHPEGAKQAVQNIIASINKSGTVMRLIYTSSCAAVMHESELDQFAKRPVFYDNRYPDFKNPNYINNPKANGYALGKLACEQTVTTAAEASGGQWDVLITNPGDNFGPMHAAHHLRGGGGIFNSYVARMMQGKVVGTLAVYHPMWSVDVRDTAEGHVLLLENAEVQSGERFLLWSTNKLQIEDLVSMVGGLFPAAGFDTTAEVVDKESDDVKKNKAYFTAVWAGVQLRNDGARRIGAHFRPFEATLRDTAESLVAICGVQPRMRAGL